MGSCVVTGAHPATCYSVFICRVSRWRVIVGGVMKYIIVLVVSLFPALIFGGPVLAAEASVTIQSPADGAKLDVMEQVRVEYDVVPGPRGDHLHFYVDGKEVALLRQLKGSYLVESLAAGQHALCIKVVNKNHTPIGVEQCISVTME